MYIPKPFSIDDAGALHAFMRRHAFATLVTAPEGVPTASHLPFLIDAGGDGPPVLHAHMARANPQWQDFAAIDEALVIFLGAHAYVSPSWYANPGLVPTWNYTAVHAYGKPRLIEDAAAALAHLERLVAVHEGAFETPWRPESLGDGVAEGMVRGIVAFEMPIERLEGKFKLSQNRKSEDRAGAAAGLRATGNPDALEVARLMAEDGA